MSRTSFEQDVCLQEASPKTSTSTDSRTRRKPYLPLNTERKQIRLLELLPGLWRETIRSTLRTVSLDTGPSYEALSYTWGGYNEKRTLCINGYHRIKVTDNLFNALRRLRHQTGKRILWIDAICIDQSNVEERGQQVSIMGDVYKQAMTVLVWLGEYPKPSITDQWRMRRPHWKRKGYSTVINTRGRRFAEALNRALCDTEPKWYERAWVIQEFVLSRETLLCFGPVSLAYDALHFIDLLMSYPSPIPGVRAFHERTSDMMRLKHFMADGTQSISEAALMTCTSSCSNPRDKVYSLLSLIDGREASAIETNYKRTCAEIFANATYAAIVAQGNFEILELACFEGCPTPELPSWAVDFVREQEPYRGWVHREVSKNIAWHFNASSETPFVGMSPETKALVVSGAPFDNVAETFVMPASNGAASGDGLAEELIPLMRNISQTFNQRAGASHQLQIPDHEFNPSLLLIGKVLTQVHTVLNTAFTLWNEFAATSSGRRSNDHRPFWQCDKEERRARESKTPYTSMGVGPFLDYAAFVAGGDAVVFTTQQGFMGIAPGSLAPGDVLLLLRNSKLPVILRDVGGSCAFRGFAYVHGIYDVETIDIWEGGDEQEKEYMLC